MTKDEINEIIQCLPKGKTYFHYFKDRYALLLLSYFVGEGQERSQIKNSQFGKLLNKKIIQNAVAKAGRSIITKDTLYSWWPENIECYLLTLGQWGSGYQIYDQASRSGYNLVLQLNFSSKHNRPYYKIIQPKGVHPFEYQYHPIARKGYHTLAWARLDIDIKENEALIEEVQNDWIRLSIYGKTTIEQIEQNEDNRYVVNQHQFEGIEVDSKKMNKYIEDVLKPHMSLWDEAMLCSTIWFLKEEIGIQRIFYHTYDSGIKLKGIYGKGPPRSIYTTLPRKFCFQQTEEIPNFLVNYFKGRKNKIKYTNARFQLLDFTNDK